jgi:hypothetical protein
VANWARLRRLSWPERWWLLQALLLLPLTSLALRWWGFRRWQVILAGLLPGRPALAIDDRAQTLAQACGTARLVEALARRLPFRASCLHQSWVLWWLLRRQGIPAELRIGVRKPASQLEAHAWVEYQDRVLNDADDVRQRYAPFDGPIVPAEVKAR